MNVDFSSAFLLPLPATQEWGEDRGEGHPHRSPSSPQPSPPSDGGEGVSLVAAGTEQQKNIQHPTSNFQSGIVSHLVRCSALDVGCSAGWDLNSPLRPQGNGLTSLHVGSTAASP